MQLRKEVWKKKGKYKPIRSNGTIPTTSFLHIFCCINDVMCHALWHHLLSLPYQFSTFEDVLGWQSWVMYMWLTFLICKHVTYMHVKVNNYRLSATFIVETHDPYPPPPLLLWKIPDWFTFDLQVFNTYTKLLALNHFLGITQQKRKKWYKYF